MIQFNVQGGPLAVVNAVLTPISIYISKVVTCCNPLPIYKAYKAYNSIYNW